MKTMKRMEKNRDKQFKKRMEYLEAMEDLDEPYPKYPPTYQPSSSTAGTQAYLWIPPTHTQSGAPQYGPNPPMLGLPRY